MIIGETISHYRVSSLLGAGGMGEVYKAEDTRLKRAVALKFLPLALAEDQEAKQRLVVEAQAASALDHPNICTIHEIDETADGRVFLAMAYYEGETLKQRIDRGAVPIAEALDIIVQIVRGVAAAHDAGIIHRDIKPANIFLCARTGARVHAATDVMSGSVNRSETSPDQTGVRLADDSARVKLLDFGIAKLSGQTSLTRTGTTVGTVAYMSPEHLAGQAIDERADVWSLGVVLYELLAGRLPFSGGHEIALARAIGDEIPRPLREARPDVPSAVEAIVAKTLQKDPKKRCASAHELLQDLESLRATTRSRTAATETVPHRTRRHARTWALGAALALFVAALAVWFGVRAVRARETQRTVAEIRQLVETEQNAAALRRLHSVPAALFGEPEVVRLRNDFFAPLTVRTDPADADIHIKGYDEPDAEWVHLGRSPIETRGTIGAFRWRVTKAGYETFEGSSQAQQAWGEVRFALVPEGRSPPGTVRVPGGTLANIGRLPEFFIDRYEVTNKDFKRFVDAGGYRDARYWQEPFVRDGRTLPWDQGVAELRDATGRPGPATWELGTYAEGQDDWPVRGISWYEAAAYARFAGKSLPTVHHWR
ncbi:MAG: bifunctional serine/threonine-protein kinase/formylglycine-generating enzyme family protein, partial [Vicinamibacterales bacterium]